MNIKYIIALNALIALAGTSCWGAANKQRSVNEQRLNQLEELPAEIIELIAESLDPSYLMELALVNKKISQITIPILKKKRLAELIKTHNGNLQEALFDVVNNHKPWAIIYLVRAGANINAINNSTLTPLMWAAHKDDKAMVNQLILTGADVNATNNAGRTALMYAAAGDREAITAQLIQVGANVNAVGNDGYTPLKYAAREGFVNMIDQLTQAGANVNANDRGFTALDEAEMFDRADAVTRLKKAGAKSKYR